MGERKRKKTAQLQEGSLHKSVVVTPTALLEKLTASRALVINVQSTGPWWPVRPLRARGHLYFLYLAHELNSAHLCSNFSARPYISAGSPYTRGRSVNMFMGLAEHAVHSNTF